MRRVLSAALACALAAVVAPVAARAASGGPLAYDTIAAVVADAERSQVFVAGRNQGDEAVTVTDFAGGVVARIPTGTRSTDLALDTAHDVLHVALPASGEILHVAAGSRQVLGRTAVTQSTECGLRVEMAGARLWALTACATGGKLLGFTPGDDGLPAGQVSLDVDTSYAGLLAGTETGRYLVLERGSTADGGLLVVDVEPDQPAVVAASAPGTFADLLSEPHVAGLAVAPAGDVVHVLVGRPYRLQSLRLPDLAPLHHYHDAEIPHPDGLSVSPDGRRIAVTQLGWYETDLAVYAVGEPAPVASADWYDAETAGAWVSDDRLLVPARAVQWQPFAMQVVTGLGVLPARIAATAAPTGPDVRVTGRLRMTDGAAAGDRVLRVWRSAAGRPTVELPPVVTGGDGGFGLDDTPPHPGRWRYRVRWEGDGTRAAAVAMATATVAGTPPPLPPPPLPAAVTPPRVRLPGDSHTEIVNDPANHRLYVSGGGLLTVTDADGGNQRTVAGVTSPMGIALSADGTTLYAGSGTGAIHAVDLATTELVATWTTRPWGRIATFVGEAGGRVFFGHQNPSTTAAGWGVLDPGDPGAPRLVLRAGGPSYGPVFASSPDGTLTGGSLGQSPAYVGRWDVTGSEPAAIAGRSHFPGLGSNLRDIEPTPDGRHVLVATGAPYHTQLLDAATLATVRTYDVGPYPGSVAVTPDSRLHASGADSFYVYQPTVLVNEAVTGLRLNGFRLGNVAPRGLAFDAAGTRLYAVQGKYDEPIWLNVIPYPAVPRACLVVDPVPGTVPVGSPLTFAGVARALDGSPAAGSTVRLVRQSDEATLATATVDGAGRWSLATVPPAVGPVGYDLRRDGCDVVSRLVEVVRRPTSLAVRTTHAVGRTALVPVTLSGHTGVGQVDVWRRTFGVRHYVGRFPATSGVPFLVRVPAPSSVEARFARTATHEASAGFGGALLPARPKTWR